MNENIGDRLRHDAARILKEESNYTASVGLSPQDLDARQTYIAESEFASRLRATFTDLETFMHAQGKNAERDIVSFKHGFELEIKYFAGETAADREVAFEDWQWLVGHVERKPQRPLRKFLWAIFPRAHSAHGSRGAGNFAEHPWSRWPFQHCISFIPRGQQSYLPYASIVEEITPLDRSGYPMKDNALRYREKPIPQALLQDSVQGSQVFVRADILGAPYDDSAWGLFYEVAADSNALQASGYTLL